MIENERYTVEFKLKSFSDKTRWEDVAPVGVLTCYTDDEADEAARVLSGVFCKECRWNWFWSNQGHYIQHSATLALHLAMKDVNSKPD